MKKKRSAGILPIHHKQMFIPERGHKVDLLVLNVLERLWDKEIQTFYSCQGGPTSIRVTDGTIFYNRAYAQIFEADIKRAKKILKKLGLHPKIDIHPKRVHKDRVAIRFDPCEAAMRLRIGFDAR